MPNALKWDEDIFFSPGIAFGIAMAKVRQWLALRPYLLTLAAAGLLIYLHILVMHVRTRDLCRWLRGEGIFMRAGGDPAGGMAGALYSADFSWINWWLYASPGVVLMAVLLAVRPLRASNRAAVSE